MALGPALALLSTHSLTPMFKKLFKKKEGGTFFGNLIRKGSQVAAGSLSLVPGVGSMLAPLASSIANGLNPIPGSAGGAAAAADVATAAGMPAQDPEAAQLMADRTFSNVQAAGGSVEDAKTAARAVRQFAVQPASLTRQEVKDVLNGTVDGALNGAATSWANKTASGNQTREELTEDAIKKYAPFVLGGGALLYFMLKKR